MHVPAELLRLQLRIVRGQCASLRCCRKQAAKNDGTRSGTPNNV